IRVGSGEAAVDAAALESFERQRIGNRFARFLGCEGGEMGELAPAALPDGVAKRAAKVAEEEEGLARAELLAHEEKRRRRREKKDRDGGAERFARGERDQPLAEGAVAYLIVVLDEIDEGKRRQVTAGLAARCAAKRRQLSLIDEALRQGAPEAGNGIGGIVAVIAVGLAGEGDMHRVVEVVVPLRIVGKRRSASAALEITGLVLVVLEDQVDVRAADRSPHFLRQLGEKMRRAFVLDRVHGVEAQAVGVVFLEPIERVVDEEPPRDSAEIDRLAPSGRALRKELRCVERKIIPFRP